MTTVCALQVPHVWGDVPGALARLDEGLGVAAGAELVLLPEASFTGYVSPRGETDLRPFAEEVDGPTMQAVARLAAKHGVAVAAPLIEREGASAYNALVLVDAQGRRVGRWRKRHPWIPETWATPGDAGTPVVEWRGRRVSAAICYDVHFLAAEAAGELERADLLLFPSAWVEEGADTRVARLRALARRFGLPVVNANWARSEPALPGQGGSVILDAQGRVLARARGAEVEALRAEV
jgi:predicted amidohydrolase